MNDLVEAALAKVLGDADTRRELRAARARLGNALAAHADVAAGEAPPATDARAAKTPALPRDDGVARAHAFRVMAGVAA